MFGLSDIVIDDLKSVLGNTPTLKKCGYLDQEPKETIRKGRI